MYSKIPYSICLYNRPASTKLLRTDCLSFFQLHFVLLYFFYLIVLLFFFLWNGFELEATNNFCFVDITFFLLFTRRTHSPTTSTNNNFLFFFNSTANRRDHRRHRIKAHQNRRAVVNQVVPNPNHRHRRRNDQVRKSEAHDRRVVRRTKNPKVAKTINRHVSSPMRMAFVNQYLRGRERERRTIYYLYPAIPIITLLLLLHSYLYQLSNQ